MKKMKNETTPKPSTMKKTLLSLCLLLSLLPMRLLATIEVYVVAVGVNNEYLTAGGEPIE